MTKLAPRDHFTDEEWSIVQRGKCPNVTAAGHHGLRIEHCKKPIDPNSRYRYCRRCTRDVDEDYPDRGGR